MFRFFKSKTSATNPFLVDFHSHLIPGIDDGVKTAEEAADILERLQQLGYRKVITTPHIMGDFYPNTPEIIREGKTAVEVELKQRNLQIEFEAAAEYHLDEKFVEIINEGAELLTFGDKYILFETPFMNEPVYLKEVVFKLSSLGLKPILAHPERYGYLMNNQDLIDDLLNRGVLFQINLMSLTGHYSSAVKKMAEKLIKKGFVHFFGSDIHNPGHLEIVKKAYSNRFLQEAHSRVLNNTLL